MQDLKKIVLEYIDLVWNKKDMNAMKILTGTEFKYYIGTGQSFDHQSFENFLNTTHSAFPDWEVKPDRVIAESDTVAVQWSGKVTHKGVFYGIPPTGKQISVSGINLYTLKNGKIVSEWEQTDTIGMLKQMGVF